MRLPGALKLVIAILACQAAGVIGSIFTTPAIDTWYATLTKPSFAPPNWVFAPAWITLYFLMGLAAFLVWRKGLNYPYVKAALVAFCVQLALNAFWSAAFFGLRSPLAGLVVIVALWVAIIVTISYFLRVSRVAGILLLPYLGWVTFAALLNFYLYNLNKW
jgi:tryptophan-rich sensory protein